MKNICVVIGSRANYSSIKAAMSAIQNHPNLNLQVILMASALLERYGAVSNLIEQDGFQITARINMLIEGETPTTMAKSTGLGLIELPTIFEQIKPDVVITVGDRFETMATAISAAFMNIPLAHTMGGEVTGTIDESIRHAITKFSHIHFPASPDAKERIIALGEAADTVHHVGCPRIDLIAAQLKDQDKINQLIASSCNSGVGQPLDFTKPFLLISQHPVTTEYGESKKQITATLEAASRTGLQSFVLWPNPDAGSEDISRGIRTYREHGLANQMFFSKNLPIATYIALMSKTACLIGNSSSGIRDGAYIGTPVVNIGTRQNGRECGQNVIHANYDVDSIEAAIKQQIAHGPYPMDPIYGEGNAGVQIADILSSANFTIQKRITY